MLVFMNSWYREKLGIQRDLVPGSKVGLTIELREKTPIKWMVYACVDHPQVVVRLATWLGLLGLGLGVIGVGLGMLALGEDNSFVLIGGEVVILAGFIVLVWGTLLMKRRSPHRARPSAASLPRIPEGLGGHPKPAINRHFKTGN
jgi:hypothetical protein